MNYDLPGAWYIKAGFQAKNPGMPRRNTFSFGQNRTLMDVLVEKGYLSRKKIKQVQQELEHTDGIKPDCEQAQDRRSVGRYQIIQKIGEGAMGVVYQATNTSNNRIVALKLLDKELSEDPEFIARFLREARNAAKLKKHENIVEAYDFGQADGHYYFAMEFVNGRCLAEILFCQGKLSERTALNITRQLTRALSHANNFSIIHRDIKPENIIISQDGIVKLCDLGLAKDLSRDFSRQSAGITLGTAYYASPEQASGCKDLDIRADIYSVGITLYYMLSGELPFDDSNTIKVIYRQINEEMPLIEDKATISAQTAALVKKMTKKKLAERYQSPEEVLEDIENILQGKPTTTSRILAKPPLQKAAIANPKMLKKKKRTTGISSRRLYTIALVIGLSLVCLLLIRWLMSR